MAERKYQRNRVDQRTEKFKCEGDLDSNSKDSSAKTRLLLCILPNVGFLQTLQPPTFVEKT
jgi:hypothetical protein